MNFQKITMTVLGLIALYLIISNGNTFNEILKTAGGEALKGGALLQGRKINTVNI